MSLKPRNKDQKNSIRNKDKKVSIIIPNWNGVELLKTSLPAVSNLTYKNTEVIIIENGSTDSSVAYIEKFFPEFTIIKLKKNIGFSPAINIGVKAAKGEYVFLLNNDTEINKKCLSYLVAILEEKPDVGMVAAKMIQFDNRKLIDSAGDVIDVVGHAKNFGIGEKDGPSFNQSKYIFLVTGGGSLFRKKMFLETGGYDDDYFAYMEDVDFSLRAQLQGYKAYYEPQAVIYHMQSATSKKNQSLKEYWQFRNMTMTVIKDFPKALLIKDLNWLKILLVNLNTVLFLTRNGYFLSAIKAEWYIVTHLKKLLQKRQFIQTSTTIPLDDFIAQFTPKKLTFFGLYSRGL